MSKNIQLKDTHRASLISMASSILMRKVALTEALCPLSPQDVYNGVASPDVQAMFATLRDMGFYLSRTNTMKIDVAADDEVVRQGTIELTSMVGYRFPAQEKPLPFDLDTLGDRRGRFVAWANEAVRQRRAFTAAELLVKEFVNKRCGESLCSAVRRWPDFAVVPLAMGDPWPERVRDLPQINRAEYDWPQSGATYDWLLDNERKLEIVGGMLAGGHALPSSVNDTSTVKGEVVDWDRTSP